MSVLKMLFVRVIVGWKLFFLSIGSFFVPLRISDFCRKSFVLQGNIVLVRAIKWKIIIEVQNLFSLFRVKFVRFCVGKCRDFFGSKSLLHVQEKVFETVLENSFLVESVKKEL